MIVSKFVLTVDVINAHNEGYAWRERKIKW